MLLFGKLCYQVRVWGLRSVYKSDWSYHRFGVQLVSIGDGMKYEFLYFLCAGPRHGALQTLALLCRQSICQAGRHGSST